MKLIIFLGNPGLKYRKTRHNVGFLMGDVYAKQQELKWKGSTKFSAEIAELAGEDEKILLVKPQKYYNLTGEVVQSLIKFYKVAPETDLLVICDDLNLDLGVVRVRTSGSDGGNNGLKSIISKIGDNFTRVRIGTSNELLAKQDAEKFVLSRFTSDEDKHLPAIYQQVRTLIDEFIASQLDPKTL